MMLLKKVPVFIALAGLGLAGCKNMNNSQKGAVIGTTGGAAAGAVVGKTAGNTALGAIIGATVGGVAGAIIGKQMDKQAEEIKNTVPEAKVERVEEGIKVEFTDKVLFGFDQSNLSDRSKATLDKLITVLNTYPDTDIEIQGHTDSKGSEAYNQKLSDRRANAVSSYLLSHNVSSARVKSKGMGENFPAYSNDTEEGRAQNRRVEFLISANEKMKADAQKEANQ